MLEIISEDGSSNKASILVGGKPIDKLTKVQITLEVGEPIRVEYEKIQEPINIKIQNFGFKDLLPSIASASDSMRALNGAIAKGLSGGQTDFRVKKITTEILRKRIQENKDTLLEVQAYLQKGITL